jgi:hypothetical protein
MKSDIIGTVYPAELSRLSESSPSLSPTPIDKRYSPSESAILKPK